MWTCVNLNCELLLFALALQRCFTDIKKLRKCKITCIVVYLYVRIRSKKQKLMFETKLTFVWIHNNCLMFTGWPEFDKAVASWESFWKKQTTTTKRNILFSKRLVFTTIQNNWWWCSKQLCWHPSRINCSCWASTISSGRVDSKTLAAWQDQGWNQYSGRLLDGPRPRLGGD